MTQLELTHSLLQYYFNDNEYCKSFKHPIQDTSQYEQLHNNDTNKGYFVRNSFSSHIQEGSTWLVQRRVSLVQHVSRTG